MSEELTVAVYAAGLQWKATSLGYLRAGPEERCETSLRVKLPAGDVMPFRNDEIGQL